MRILAPLLLCTAFAALQACSSMGDPSDLEANILVPGDFIKGSGVVDNIGVLPQPGSEPNRYRLYLRMDVGGTQSVDVDKSIFMAGQFVELTNDGRVVLLSGTSMNEQSWQRQQKP